MKEQDHRSQEDRLGLPFEFTYNEKLFSVLLHARFMKFATDPTNTIYTADLDVNSYGEFLFVTIGTINSAQTSDSYTFFGLGFHEYRDRYFTDEWHFYRSSLKFDKPCLTSDEFTEIIRRRQEELASDIAWHNQSKRGQMFEEIANLTDDDGAISDLNDLLDMFDDEA